jgi:hypothetical protein
LLEPFVAETAIRSNLLPLLRKGTKRAFSELKRESDCEEEVVIAALRRVMMMIN